jgi:mRNA-degrading endonuclease RelE of RelBE toxin-antitoxin system
MIEPKWQLKFTKQAQKDAKKIAASGLKLKTQRLLEILKQNPFMNPPSRYVARGSASQTTSISGSLDGYLVRYQESNAAD